MDSTGNCSSEPEAASNAPSPPPSSGSSAGDVAKTAHPLEDSAASSPAAKRSRRSVQKRVVSIPISVTKGGAGEGAPPSDSWTWRKYGQKPIKGSPYPRGYYRCSSSKGCPARKQVERNSVDPSVIVVTYSFDHNHASPLPKNNHHHHRAPVEAVEDQPPKPVLVSQQQEQLNQLIISTAQHSSPPESTDPDEKLFDLIGEEESSLLIPNGGFHWFSEVGSSPASTSPGGSDELLYGSAFIGGGASATETATRLPEEASAGRGELEEEDSLFAGLGELPEYSFVLRRWLATSAAWVGTT